MVMRSALVPVVLSLATFALAAAPAPATPAAAGSLAAFWVDAAGEVHTGAPPATDASASCGDYAPVVVTCHQQGFFRADASRPFHIGATWCATEGPGPTAFCYAGTVAASTIDTRGLTTEFTCEVRAGPAVAGNPECSLNTPPENLPIGIFNLDCNSRGVEPTPRLINAPLGLGYMSASAGDWGCFIAWD